VGKKGERSGENEGDQARNTEEHRRGEKRRRKGRKLKIGMHLANVAIGVRSPDVGVDFPGGITHSPKRAACGPQRAQVGVVGYCSLSQPRSNTIFIPTISPPLTSPNATAGALLAGHCCAYYNSCERLLSLWAPVLSTALVRRETKSPF
jgi:hypothetical protein